MKIKQKEQDRPAGTDKPKKSKLLLALIPALLLSLGATSCPGTGAGGGINNEPPKPCPDAKGCFDRLVDEYDNSRMYDGVDEFVNALTEPHMNKKKGWHPLNGQSAPIVHPLYGYPCIDDTDVQRAHAAQSKWLEDNGISK